MKRLLSLLFILVALFGLSGCIRYDVGINYASQTHGEIVQRIRVGQPIANRGDSQAKVWLTTLEQRAKKLGGRIRRPNQQELVVTIPFNNGSELTQKFNQFFAALSDEDAGEESGVAVPEIASKLSLRESNLLLVERNRLVYDVDLRSLGVLSPDGTVLVSPGALLEMEFSLNTPWGGRSLDDSLIPKIDRLGRRFTWTLKAGETNHIEAIFWIPSPLGIGTAVIVGLVALGAGFKAQLSRQAPV
ncbi:DUF3153 domain-containing protein [Leptolyngbya sp. AN02str]|uniref:DUF3153 domain-containing protein n=1 Tax=Leptolyngbya sp. AN02str TaxID=3423363 RepID=UPI003D321371